MNIKWTLRLLFTVPFTTTTAFPIFTLQFRWITRQYSNLHSKFAWPFQPGLINFRWKWTSCGSLSVDGALRAAMGAGSGDTGSGGGGDAEVLSSSLDRAWNRWANCDTLAPTVLHTPSSPFDVDVYNITNQTNKRKTSPLIIHYDKQKRKKKT